MFFTKKKSAALLLALLMAASAFTGCAGSEDGSGDAAVDGTTAVTTAASAEETAFSYTANVPAGTNYNGYEFRICVYDQSNAVWHDVDFSAETETGDTINDAVYRRMVNTEEALGIDIIARPDAATGSNVKLLNAVKSDEDAYDIASLGITNAYNAAREHALIDLFTTDIQLDAPWWDQNAIDEMSIAHKLYMLEGDISILYKKTIGSILFNKEMYAENNLPNPYEKVEDKTWTFDFFADSVKTVANDLNGDSKMDTEDQWGILIPIDIYNAALIGCGVDFCTKDADDIPQLSFFNERTEKVFSTILAFSSDEAHVYGVGTTGSDDRARMFSQGQCLFTYAIFYQIEALRQMDGDFGILPMPLFDSTQESYYHSVHAVCGSCITIPVTNRDLTRTAYVLDTLGAESKNILTPAYMDTYLKGKGSRDNESEAILDLIFSTLDYDIGFSVGFGGMGSFARDLLNNKKDTLASTYQKIESKIIQDRDAFIEAFQK